MGEVLHGEAVGLLEEGLAFGRVEFDGGLFDELVELGVGVEGGEVGVAEVLIGVGGVEEMLEGAGAVAVGIGPADEEERAAAGAFAGEEGGLGFGVDVDGDADACEFLGDALEDLFVVDVAVVGAVEADGEAVGEAGLGEEGAGAVVVGAGEVEVGDVAGDALGEELGGGGGVAGHDGADDEDVVDAEGDGATDAGVAQGVGAAGDAGGVGAVGIEAEVDEAEAGAFDDVVTGEGLDAVDHARGDVDHDVVFGALEGGHAGGVVGGGDEFEAVDGGAAGPVVRVGLEGADFVLAPLGEAVGAGAVGAGGEEGVAGGGETGFGGLAVEDEDGGEAEGEDGVRDGGGDEEGVVVDGLEVGDGGDFGGDA